MHTAIAVAVAVAGYRFPSCGNWSPNEPVSTQVKEPSGGDRREPQRPDLWQYICKFVLTSTHPLSAPFFFFCATAHQNVCARALQKLLHISYCLII